MNFFNFTLIILSLASLSVSSDYRPIPEDVKERVEYKKALDLLIDFAENYYINLGNSSLKEEFDVTESSSYRGEQLNYTFHFELLRKDESRSIDAKIGVIIRGEQLIGPILLSASNKRNYAAGYSRGSQVSKNANLVKGLMKAEAKKRGIELSKIPFQLAESSEENLAEVNFYDRAGNIYRSVISFGDWWAGEANIVSFEQEVTTNELKNLK